MTLIVGRPKAIRRKKLKVKPRNQSLELFFVLGALLLPSAMAMFLMAITAPARLISPDNISQPYNTTLTTPPELEPPPEIIADTVEQPDDETLARYQALELKLVQAERLEELEIAETEMRQQKERRYEASFNDAIRLDTPAGTTVYALGGEKDQVNVSCEQTEFGDIATLATSASPERFYKAFFLQTCNSGVLAGGAVVGETVSEMGWSEHQQATGAPTSPNTTATEWALTGYTGQHKAPPRANAVDVGATVNRLWQTAEGWVEDFE